MTVKAQKPIVIFRGDNTAAFDLRTITILLTGDLDLSHATARFTLLDFSKTWTEQEVATGELNIVFTAEQTKAFALGPQTGTLRLYDMSTGTPRQLTVVNKIPFFITNRVCEMDSQSYEADVCVSGGDVIHVEFNVGVEAVKGKADKVKNATAGDLASLTADGNLEDSGIPKNDVLRKSQMDSAPTLGSQNPVTSDGIKQALDLATPSDYAQVKAQVQQNTGDIADIKEVIPNQASAQNQLADKDFVNSSIQTNTATFRGSYNLVSDLGLTVSATEQQVAAAIAAKLASLVPPVVPENNDYCFVQVPKTDADPTVIERVDRYKCTVTESGGVTTRVWEYEWSLNNSSFTADQWAAINSGITSGLVEKLNGIEAGAQVNTVTSVNTKTGAVTLSASDVGALGNTGKQTLEGSLSIIGTHGLVETLLSVLGEIGIRTWDGGTHGVRYLADGIYVSTDGEQTFTKLSFPAVAGTLALLSDVYAAVQQIAPAFEVKTAQVPYQRGDIVSKDGVVYQCNVDDFIGEWDAASWVAKPVSELFLPLKGGEIDGNISVRGLTDIVSGARFFGRLNFDINVPGSYVLYGDDKVAYLDFVRCKDKDAFCYLSDLAPTYSASSTYAVESLCVRYDEYDFVKLYRCTTAITTAEAWTAAHWTEATVKDVLALKAPLASPAFTGTPTAPTPTSGDNSTKVATTAFVQGALPYAIGAAQTISTASQDSSGGTTINYGEATLADRTANKVIVTTALDELRVSFPAAISDKVRDFELRLEVGTGSAALTAPAIVIVPPSGETITLENADGAWPTLEDGTATAKGVTALYFSETAAGKFLVKGEAMKEVA